MRTHTRRSAAVALISLPPGFRSSLLEGLTPSDIEAVLATATPRRMFPRQVIQQEGEPATHLFLLVTGRAAHYAVTDAGKKVFLRWIEPGRAFGLRALQRQPTVHATTVEMIHRCTVLTWERASARALVLQHPRILENAYSSLLDSWVNVFHKLMRAAETAQQRLAQVLVDSARQIGSAAHGGVRVDLTDEQLAEMAEVSVFTASRQLSEWQRQGILAKSRGKILLRAPERLISQDF